MLNLNLKAECEKKFAQCSKMLIDYTYQAHAHFRLGDLPKARKHFEIVVKVADSLLGTCEVAVRYDIHVEEAAFLTGIARSFREDSVTSSGIISRLMTADPARHATGTELPASGIRDRQQS